MIHNLKILNEFFEEVFLGDKTFEIRKNDRNFKKGDFLVLREWNLEAEEYTGRVMARKVTYILEGGAWGLKKGFVAMGISPVGVIQKTPPHSNVFSDEAGLSRIFANISQETPP